MPSRKQRRRRLKERRHEYEYVYVDEEGQELEVEPEVAVSNGKPKTVQKAKAKGPASARGRREAQPPSWRRVGKRTLIFAPFMFLTISIVGKDLSTTQKIIQTLLLLVVFLPFTYLIELMTYRAYMRRSGADGTKAQSGGESPPR
jgi:hypothetical protein